MRAADEKRERSKKVKGSGKSPGKKWGRYTHYAPDKAEKAAIKAKSEGMEAALLLWLDSMLDSGFQVSLHWIEDREAVRAQMRAPGDEPMSAPALAAYHVSAKIALTALKYAHETGAPDWQEERMTAEEADNW